ncbi:MAG: hypothetical protein AABY22_12320 [Nanoarchaeota archaeon]
MSNYLEDRCSQFYEELGNPSGVSEAYIKNWFISNVGALNLLINTNYSGVTGIINPEISGDAMIVFKEFFLKKYYDRQISLNLGANAYNNDWVEISEEGTKIRRPAKTEIAKNYQVLSEKTQNNLDYYVKLFRSNTALPLSQDIQEVGHGPASDPLSYVHVHY